MIQFGPSGNSESFYAQGYSHTEESAKFVKDMGLDCFEPQGAFYVFPSIQTTGLSSEEFCERLLYENHTAVVPGTAFGDSGEGFIRCSYAYSIKSIQIALERIEEFLKTLK